MATGGTLRLPGAAVGILARWHACTLATKNLPLLRQVSCSLAQVLISVILPPAQVAYGI